MGDATSLSESLTARWMRRVITIPAAFIALASLTVAALIGALPALVLDAVLRRRGASLRFGAALWVFVFMECAGLIGAFAVWLTRGGAPANFRLQCWWTNTLYRLSSRVLGVRFELEPLDHTPERPILLLVRHASIIDTLLPAVSVAIPHGVRLRYLLKHQLAWDPCIDIIGQRLENVFVRRDRNASRELAMVQSVAATLSPGRGVVVFPEGTRFSAQRRHAALERLRARGDAEALERAEQLQHVLPPQPGGVLALLEGAKTADVVFLVHTGLEDARTLGDLWNGRLIGQVVRVTSWRVPRDEIPRGVRARIAWLHEHWSRMDAWIDGHRSASRAT